MKSSIYALVVLLCCSVLHAEESKVREVRQLKWLAGCWGSGKGESTHEEQWTVPNGNSVLGMNRLVQKGETVSYEFMRITTEADGVVFGASLSSREEVKFYATELNHERLVVENWEHDFPQRIIYELAEDGSLAARIEGEVNGEFRMVPFPMKRKSCP